MMVNPVLIAFLVLAVAALVVFVAVRVTGARRQQAPTGRGGMAISILPGNSLGWWSVGLAVVFVVALVAVTAVPGHDLLSEDSNQSLALALKIIFIGISGASFVGGLISLIRRKELSVLVLVGMLATLWLGLVTMVAHLFME